MLVIDFVETVAIRTLSYHLTGLHDVAVGIKLTIDGGYSAVGGNVLRRINVGTGIDKLSGDGVIIIIHMLAVGISLILVATHSVTIDIVIDIPVGECAVGIDAYARDLQHVEFVVEQLIFFFSISVVGIGIERAFRKLVVGIVFIASDDPSLVVELSFDVACSVTYLYHSRDNSPCAVLQFVDCEVTHCGRRPLVVGYHLQLACHVAVLVVIGIVVCL